MFINLYYVLGILPEMWEQVKQNKTISVLIPLWRIDSNEMTDINQMIAQM